MTRLELIMTDARRPIGPDDVPALLKRMDRPAAPDDMVAKVRARLAAERARAVNDDADAESEPWLAPAAPSSSSAELPGKRAWWRYGAEAAVAACALVAVVIALQLGDDVPRSSSGAAEAAGIGGQATIVDVRLVVDGLDDARVHVLARETGLVAVDGPDGVSYEGGASDVKRFLVRLRVEAARAGSEVKGFVPDAAKMRLTIATQ